MKRTLALLGTVALVMSVVLTPAIAYAATTDVSGQVAETPTVISITPDSGSAGATLTGVRIVGTNFEAGLTVSFSGTGGVSATNVVRVDSTNITADVVITAGATAGARDVIVTQGGKTSTGGTGLFTVSSAITVNAPSGITLGLMTAGATTPGSSAVSGNVTTNAETWQVEAVDTKGTNTGHMVNGSGTPLTNKFQISSDNTNFVSANTTLPYGSVTTLPFYVKQAVVQSDAGGSYSIIITFVGTVQ